MSKKKNRNQACAYCGRVGKVTEDHIPPKNLFPGIPNNELIKVPACDACNNKFSKDDEYFRLITLREDVINHPTVKKIYPSVKRSFQRNEAARFRQSFINSVTKIRPITPGGILLPLKTVARLETERIENTIERITRGLFYYYKEYPVPNEYSVLVITPWAFSGETEEEVRWFDEFVFKPLTDRPRTLVGDDTFTFKFVFANDEPNLSIWLYLFFGKITFVACVMPKSVTGKQKTHAYKPNISFAPPA